VSAMPHEYITGEPTGSVSDDTVLTGSPVVVRRNAGLAALVGAAASAVAIAYLWRATQSGSPLDWGLCLLMAVIGCTFLANLVDARTPLVVADDLGVRIRLGNQWRGLPWEAVEQVLVRPRRGLLHDGRLVFAPHSMARALEGLDARGRRHALLNQRMYGAPLAVPLGLTTRLTGRSDRSGESPLADDLAALVLGRTDVVVVHPEPKPPRSPERPDPGETEQHAASDKSAHEAADTAPSAASGAEPDVRAGATAAVEAGVPAARRLVGGIGTIVSRFAKGRSRDLDVTAADEDPPVDATPPTPSAAVPLREPRHGLRAQVTHEGAPSVLGNVALHDAGAGDNARRSLPEDRELRRPGSVDLVFEAVAPAEDPRVRPIASLGEPVEPLVIEDFATEPAYDPVIGPQLAAARTRVGLSVDDLADRTRIRPHVIESIEVDDFTPCGGDFYARGHLRTLARVLGQEPGPLLEKFDHRYATAPINARRVFEAELATGMTGSMRSTVGGPRWGLLVGVVLSLVLVWGVVRLVATEPPELLQNPAPVLNGSAGLARAFPGAGHVGPLVKPLPVTLVATGGGTRVVVRDAERKVVYAGAMVLGEKKSLKVTPPVRVHAGDAGAIDVRVNGQDRGTVGEPGKPGTRTLHRPSRH
jgi:cytoskeleton protein RodZ